MLHSEERYFLSGDGFTGFMKPYEGSRYAFAALLPDEGSSLDTLAASLSGDMLTATLANAESTPVQTATPSFTGRCDMELDGALRALGMEDAFDMHSADFTGMGRSSLGSIYISTVLHGTYIELDAHGTRAAAVSIGITGDGAAPPTEPKRVILDRPFLYMIVDTQYSIPLFIGAVTGTGL